MFDLIGLGLPLIGIILMVVLILWLCHVIRQNAVIQFFRSREPDLELQNTSVSQPQNIVVVNYPPRDLNDNRLPVIPENEIYNSEIPRRSPKKVAKGRGTNRKLKAITLASLIMASDETWTGLKEDINCKCNGVMGGQPFIIKPDGTSPITEIWRERFPMTCECWNENIRCNNVMLLPKTFGGKPEDEDKLDQVIQVILGIILSCCATLILCLILKFVQVKYFS